MARGEWTVARRNCEPRGADPRLPLRYARLVDPDSMNASVACGLAVDLRGLSDQTAEDDGGETDGPRLNGVGGWVGRNYTHRQSGSGRITANYGTGFFLALG